jgi:pimeloyl-ACP methyl ester carboxylesterase
LIYPLAVSTFCLVHGAWHGPCCWEALVDRLSERGHVALAPDLPFHDARAGYEERVRPALDGLEGVTGPAVVVGHSLGATYAPLIAVARSDCTLVHLCPRLGGFTPPPGAPETFRPGVPFPATREDGTSIWERESAIAALYGRLAPATARAMARRLRPLAAIDAAYPLARHPEIATALIYAADDEIFEPAWERFIATELLGIEPIEIPGGHFPMLENPDALADLLDGLARDASGAAAPKTQGGSR